MLNVSAKATYDNRVVEYEYRTHAPFTSTTFEPNDEIRIAIQQQDGFTFPSDSYLHIVGKVTKADGSTVDNTIKLTNNAMAFLMNEIRYEIGGVIVDRTKNVGITSTIRNLLCVQPQNEKRLYNAGWFGKGVTMELNKFSFSVPLNMLMGYFEDYRRIIVNQKQELVILLASSFKNSLYKENALPAFNDFKLTIEKITWRVPYVKLSDEVQVSMLKLLNDEQILEMPFRSFELHEWPELPQTTNQSWIIKTSSQLEKPRYVIVAFQTERKNNLAKDASQFDSCHIRDIKLFLNAQNYPYDNMRGDMSLLYEQYVRFYSSFYGQHSEMPLLDRFQYERTPIFVIDCSHQTDNIKSGPVDVRLEIEGSQPIPKATSAYCLIIHDSKVEYNPLTGTVNRVM